MTPWRCWTKRVRQGRRWPPVRRPRSVTCPNCWNKYCASSDTRAAFAFLSARCFAHTAAVQPLSSDDVHRAVQAALAEDIGTGDVTSLATLPENAVAGAVMRAREPLVVAGLAFAATAFAEL